MNQDELNKILADHKVWLRGDGGKRANLSRADLRDADFWGSDLRGSDLRGANLDFSDQRYWSLRKPVIELASWDYPNKLKVYDIAQQALKEVKE